MTTLMLIALASFALGIAVFAAVCIGVWMLIGPAPEGE